MGWEDVDLIEMAYERAFVSRIMNPRIPWNAGNFFWLAEELSAFTDCQCCVELDI